MRVDGRVLAFEVGVRGDDDLAAFFRGEGVGDDVGHHLRELGGGLERVGRHGRHGQGEACGKDPETTARHRVRVVAPGFPSSIFGQ